MRYCTQHERLYVRALRRWVPFGRSMLATVVVKSGCSCDRCRLEKLQAGYRRWRAARRTD
jgi:hypothetical protein